MRVDAVAGISFGLTAAVVFNAFYKKEQFYPSVVYLTKSSTSMAVIYIQALVLVVLFGKLLRKIFFGQLRAAETEHLIERSWYAVTETCLAFTVFRDDFSPRFIALFTVLLFLKCFHWLVEDRVDYMERSPVISLLFHIRAVLLLGLLLTLDTFFIHHAYYSTLIKGASVQLVFGFEYAILLTVVATIGVKYVLHTIDLRRENPWENKSVYLLYTELFLGFAKVLLYILFMGIMVKVHTLPLFAIRPMYLTTRAFKKAVHDVIMSRRAIRNMNSLYPDATAEDLEATDNVCIICREEMRGAPAAVAATAGVAAANNNANNNNNNNGARAKKLPCGHIFHINCLRSWFQRQQTCPTCRIDILRQPAAVPAVAGNRNANEAAAAARAAAVLERVLGPAAFAGGANAVAPPVAAAAAAAAAPDQNQRGRINVAVAQPFAFLPPFFPPPPPAASEGAAAARPPFPALPFPPPFFFPPPPLHGTLAPPSTSDLTSLSADQLRSMESEERSRVEARIHTLRNIQSLLDSAVSQMNLYVASTTTSTTATTTTAPNAASAAAASESSTEVAAAAAAATAVAAPDTPASSTAAAAAVASDAANIPSETATSGLCTNAGPPTAATGAIPKTPIPKLSTKIASSEAASSSKAAGMSGEEKDAEKDDACSGGGGGGDAEKDEIRRRRLEKLSVEAAPTAEDGDKFVEEAVE